MNSPTTGIATIEPQPQPEKITVEQLWEIIRWLEDLWETEPELRRTIPEDEWLDFMKQVYLGFDSLE